MTETLNYKDQELDMPNSDIDELENGNSSEESTSIEDYLDVNTDSGESAINNGVDKTNSPTAQAVDVTIKKNHPPNIPIDNRRKRHAGFLHRRRTVSDYLYEIPMDNVGEKVEMEESNACISNVSTHQSNDDFTNERNITSAVSVEETFKYMLAYETENLRTLSDIFCEKKLIASILEKQNTANASELLTELKKIQSSVVSILKNICNNKNSDCVEDLMNKLCERQEILANYSKLLQNRLQNTSVKLQCKASSTCQNFVEMLKKPTQWTKTTFECIKRIQSYMKSDDPRFEIINSAHEELLDTSSELATPRQIKEPIKNSILVELRNNPTPDRKMVTVFLFDNALVCARQRVITLHKKFTQESESEVGSISTNTRDQTGFVMKSKSISRYDIKWFVPLNQIQSVETTGVAFDESSLRERVKTIEKLKGEIIIARNRLQEEMNQMEKESKRNKLKYPKIRRLRSLIYSLQAELVLYAPKLPLFINTTDQQCHCLLMSSEKERIDWKTEIFQRKSEYNPSVNYRIPTPVLQRNSTVRPMGNVFRDSKRKTGNQIKVPETKESELNESMKNELSYIINHCEQSSSLNKLGQVVLSGSAISGILEVCVHEVTGLTEVDSYYIAIEVDFYGQHELVAKTKSLSNTKNPIWNQSFIVELDASKSICFTLFRQFTAIGQLELPLEIDHLDQRSESYTLSALEENAKSMKIKISVVYNECSRMQKREESKNQSNMSSFTLMEILKRDQANLELLQKQFSSEKKFEKLKVPILVTTCAEEIERRGLTEEGIYRKSGTTTSVSFLKSEFDEDALLAAKQIGDYDINVVSSLLKLFFRNLAEPLISNTVMMELISATGIANEATKLTALSNALKKLPQANFDTLMYLLDHLMQVCQYEEQNKMSASNLSRIWALTIFPPEDSSAENKSGSAEANVRIGAFRSTVQITIFNTILESYAAGKLDLSIS